MPNSMIMNLRSRQKPGGKNMTSLLKFWKSVMMTGFLILLLTGCGGGGGAAGGVAFISGELVSFAGVTGPGTINNATVSVYDDSSGDAITTARVQVNGVILNYNANNQNYEGTVAVLPGDTVTLTVAVQGSTYMASGTQFTSYPTIS